MDVNGTRFHLVLRDDEWLGDGTAAAAVEWAAVEWADGAVRLARTLTALATPPLDTPPTLDQRRGVASDRFGNLYVIADGGDGIRVQRRGERTATRFWPVADPAETAAAAPAATAAAGAFAAVAAPPMPAPSLAGVAVTAEHYLVAGGLSPRGLLVFDLSGNGPPVTLPVPAGEPWSPVELAARPGGGVAVLDRANRRLWCFDRAFQPQPAVDAAPALPAFVPAGVAAAAGPVVAVGAAASAALALAETADPVGLVVLGDDTALILDDDPLSGSRLHRYRLAGPDRSAAFLATVALAEVLSGAGDPPPTAGRRGVALALTPAGTAATDAAAAAPATGLTAVLWLADAGGNQVVAFDLTAGPDSLHVSLRRALLPMRLFGGRGLVAAGSAVFYDQQGRFVALAEEPQASYARSAAIILPPPMLSAPAPSSPPTTVGATAFDGHETGCVWHRLAVDGCLPKGCSVGIESRAADTVEALERLPWQAEPALYLRNDGSEIAYHRFPAAGSERSGTFELLFQQAVGRFLQLRLTLAGSGQRTPRLQALRLHYPRFSYLHRYLPDVYAEDPVSASFLDRYLANSEGVLTLLEARIAGVQTLFDARTVPGEYLDWLAGWLGASLDGSWSDAKKRLFLAHARQLYDERGTAGGVARMVRLALADDGADASLFADLAEASAFADGGAGATVFPVRIVEGFRRRPAPPAADAATGAADRVGPGMISAGAATAGRWTPALGPALLDQRYRDHLRGQYATIAALNEAWGGSYASFDDPALRLAAVAPAAGARRDDWRRFITTGLGFGYGLVDDGDEPLYRSFLARRYPQPADLNAAYGLGPGVAIDSFADVRARLWDGQLRQALPSAAAWLKEWMLFASVVVPMRRTAHRFTVLIPVGIGESAAEASRKRAVAHRVVEVEKPAHTSFDVQLYYALFQVGRARVALDTLIGPGGRSVGLVLGSAALGATHIATAPPADTAARLVVGRETGLGRSATTFAPGRTT